MSEDTITETVVEGVAEVLNTIPTPSVPVVRQPKQGGYNRYLRQPILISNQIHFLSDREKFFAEVYVATAGNIHQACVQTAAKYGKNIHYEVGKRWIARREHIRNYINELIEKKADYASINKEEYFYQLHKLAKTNTKVYNSTVHFWRMLGELKGFYQQDNSHNTNIQINFTDGAGKQ